MKKLNVNAIRIDGGTQPRERINMEVVGDYAEAVKVGIEFPPIVVFHDGAENWLADGFHRWHAHKQAEKASILADVRAGTLLDAKLYAVGANGAHGLRRTNEDKRRAVQMVLEEPAWKDWSDRKVAEVCAVSDKTVAAVRAAIFGNSEDAKPAVRKVERAGKVYEQDTSRIGKKAESEAPAPAPAPAPAVEDEHFGPSAEELAAQEREEADERAALQRLLDADDKLAHLDAENKKLRALNRVLEERVNGLLAEKSAAVASAKKWQRKCEAAERRLKEAA